MTVPVPYDGWSAVITLANRFDFIFQVRDSELQCERPGSDTAIDRRTEEAADRLIRILPGALEGDEYQVKLNA